MKIQYISDLHLDNYSVYELITQEEKLEIVGDVLVIAGDLCGDSHKDRGVEFINQYKDKFKKIIYIPGNHEHYDSSINEETITFHEEEDNIHRLCNGVVEYDGVRFICSTMWSGSTEEATRGINDYRMIAGFSHEMENNIHNICIGFVEDELSKRFDGKTVVVTHHLPSPDCVDEPFRGSMYNSCFFTDQREMIANNDIKAWIHGHSHTPQAFEYEGTQIIRNPLGYRYEFSKTNRLESFKKTYIEV